jgi:hypothetical protein
MSTEVSDLTLDYEIGDDARSSLLLLPMSIEHPLDDQEYVVYPASTTSVLKLLKSNSIPAKLATYENKKVAYQENRSSDWFGPTILFTSALLLQNPELVSIVINIISSYVYDIFKGKAVDPSARCTFAYIGESKKKRVYYEGPLSGLSEVRGIITELGNAPSDV